MADLIRETQAQWFTPSRIRNMLRVTWTALPFGTGWSDYGGGYGGCRYCVFGDVVLVTGLALRSSGTGSFIGTLPLGARPTNRLIFEQTVSSGSSRGRIDIWANGDIQWVGGTTAVGDWVSLFGISFRTSE